ncbi:MAG: DUF4012 domain-containing protein [bacterium]
MQLKVDKNNILKQMFDVKPLKEAGDLDIVKIFSLERRLNLRKMAGENDNLNFIGKNSLEEQEIISDICRTEKNTDFKTDFRMDAEMSEKDILDEESRKFKIFYDQITAKSLENSGSSYLEKIYLSDLKNINKKPSQAQAKTFFEKKQSENNCLQNEMLEEKLFSSFKPTKQNKKYLEILSDPPKQQIPPKISEKENKNEFQESKKNFGFFDAFSFSWEKAFAGFAVFSAIFASSAFCMGYCQKSGIKAAAIKNLAIQGFEFLNEAKSDIENKNFAKAQESFENALFIFEQAEGKISTGESLLAKIPDVFGVSNKVSSGMHLMQSGKMISQAGKNLSLALTPFSEFKSSDFEDKKITDAIASSKILAENALEDINKAYSEIKKVDEKDFPENVASQIKILKSAFPEIITLLDKSNRYSANILQILGSENPKKYLLLFQNNSELRANGGFIGSFGVVDIYKGKASEIKIDGIYNPAGQLLEKIIPPLPFKKVSDKWNIFDANYFADFPTSSKKITWFYEKTGGPTVDGIITFTPQVLGDLLKISGPIYLEEFKTSVNSFNFIDQLQFEVENNYDKEENKPKKIIAVLAQKLLERVLSSSRQDWPKLLSLLQDNLNEKHILIYFSDSSQQKIIEDEGWSGKILPAKNDYLQIVHTNVNGYKTDKMIDETVGHHIKIQDSGDIISTINLTKRHMGGNSPFSWYNEQNGDFLRIYTPFGSSLISAEGFSSEDIYSKTTDFSDFKTDEDIEKIEKNMERDKKSGVFIFEEAGKTVFAGWVYTDPGKISTIKISYKLPFKFSIEPSRSEIISDRDNYEILYQKQSGHPGSKFNIVFEAQGNIEKRTVDLITDERVEFELGG